MKDSWGVDSSFSLSPSARLVAFRAGAEDYDSTGRYQLELWDAVKGAKLKSFPAGTFGAVTFSNNSRFLASCGQEVTVWDIDSGESLVEIPFLDPKRSSDWMKILRFSPDGDRLVGAGGGKVSIWETGSWTERLSFPIDLYSGAFAISFEGSVILGCSGRVIRFLGFGSRDPDRLPSRSRCEVFRWRRTYQVRRFVGECFWMG